MQGGYRISDPINTPKRIGQVTTKLHFRGKKKVTPFLGPLF
jgi:hypothetical protein